MLVNQLYYSCFNLCGIYIYDRTLVEIFTDKARWYQLHFIINMIVVLKLYGTIYNLIIDPKNYYLVNDKNDLSNFLSNYHICLHVYHLLCFKNLNFWDYFHHILFVFIGIIPGIIYINSNQLYFHKFICGGLPGMIEYGSLVLYKHDILTKYQQKKINTILYTFFRLPLCVLGSVYNMLAYYNNYINDPLWITIYVNLMLYLNGTIFTYLTFDSFYKLKNS
jgi:hypothetical protein